MAGGFAVAALIILGIGLVGGIIAWMVLAERKRRRELEAWAIKHDFATYDATTDLGWLKGFDAWGPGYGHRAFDGYQGTHDDWEVRVFQHQSRTKTKDGENVHNYTICVAEAPLNAPKLTIRREHFGHKLVDALGGEDIDFESHEFSKKFWVKCKDRKFAYDVLHPRMMEFFLAAPKAAWEWQGNRLVLVMPYALRPPRANALINNAAKFLALLPRHLERS